MSCTAYLFEDTASIGGRQTPQYFDKSALGLDNAVGLCIDQT